MPGLSIELDQLSPDLCRLLGHDKLLPWRSVESVSLKRIASDCYYIPKIGEGLIRSHCIPVQTGDRLQRRLKFSDLGVGDMRLVHPRQAAHALFLSADIASVMLKPARSPRETHSL
jgi:hypothetical protein